MVRALLGPECAIGVSVHSPEECHQAQTAGADYLLLGTIFATPSHPGEPGAGVSLISRCADAGPPLIAIGGMDESCIPDVIEAGARGIAVIRAVWGADDPVHAVRRLASLLAEQASSGEGKQQQGGSVMQIEVNGTGRVFQAGGSVRELLVELELDPRMVVVERNREIIRREELDSVLVAEGDRYEIVQFVGGG
jgi:thiamine biosynthesis protein ThiS